MHHGLLRTESWRNMAHHTGLQNSDCNHRFAPQPVNPGWSQTTPSSLPLAPGVCYGSWEEQSTTEQVPGRPKTGIGRRIMIPRRMTHSRIVCEQYQQSETRTKTTNTPSPPAINPTSPAPLPNSPAFQPHIHRRIAARIFPSRTITVCVSLRVSIRLRSSLRNGGH